jgi:hypothetical protein
MNRTLFEIDYEVTVVVKASGEPIDGEAVIVNCRVVR